MPKQVPLMDRVRKLPGRDACWVWTGARYPTGGYGAMWVNELGQPRRVHRLAWEAEKGPIPNGLCVLHRCDNRLCVRVSHLFLGDRADNVRDAMVKDRLRHGENHTAAKLTEAAVRDIRRKLAEGEGVAAIARTYGVSTGAISNVRLGRTWRRVA